jgi:hypothetical protein
LTEIDEAEVAARGSPIPEMPFSLFRLFDETGDRGKYEALYFERRRRLVSAGLAAWLWEGSERTRALEDLIWAICGEYTWALPAHLEGSCLDPASLGLCRSGSAEREALAGTAPWPQGQNLDLFSCETAFALAEILSLVGERLTPIVARRAESEVEGRVLTPFLARHGPWRWELMVNNWCAVCAGSIGAAALYLYEDQGRKAEILARALPTLDRFLDSFSADGVCLEGLGYWTYGMGFFASFAELLSQASNGELELLADERARHAAAFQSTAYLDGRTALSFADGSSSERYRRGLSAQLARRFPEASLPPPGLAAGFCHDRYGRFCLSLRDLIWSVPSPDPRESEHLAANGPAAPRLGTKGQSAEERRPLYFWFPDAQWLICPSNGTGGLAFAAKGGNNDEPHNHNDLGSFELVLDGVEALADLGCGEYTRDYFNDDRYSIFCTSSFGHSLPIVNGRGQSPGADRRTKDLIFRVEGTKVVLSMDITGAYEVPGLENLVRAFEYDGESKLIVSDSFVFSDGINEVIERFVTRSLPTLDWDAASPRGTIGAPVLSVSCSLPGLAPEIAIHPHREHDGTTTMFKSLDYALRCAERQLSVRFEFALKSAEPG